MLNLLEMDRDHGHTIQIHILALHCFVIYIYGTALEWRLLKVVLQWYNAAKLKVVTDDGYD